MIHALVTDRQISTSAVIRELRNEKGLTLRQLAERANVSDSAVSRWENGERIPNVDAYIRIIEALDAEVVIIRKKGRGADRVPAPEGVNNA